jgi:hypothetical protein
MGLQLHALPQVKAEIFNRVGKFALQQATDDNS